ncbi:MAG TPA: hypothetical protein VFB12_09515 [Ktedonobacteraceae bacterium]|nr:hypothetical protein [Ktedonobacteraceae bacterium]
MKYYRLALQDPQTSRWIWKTTPLTSLQAVFQLLRIYGALPQDHIRVFTASSKEDLSEMLRCENNNLVSGSVTAAQFSCERNIQVREQVPCTLECRTAELSIQQTTVTSCIPLREHNTTSGSPGSSGMSSLDKRRLELECGAGGDHDTPYIFILPNSMPQVIAWIALLVKVQDGEL